jgi:hypothetical protein
MRVMAAVFGAGSRDILQGALCILHADFAGHEFEEEEVAGGGESLGFLTVRFDPSECRLNGGAKGGPSIGTSVPSQ